MDDEDPTVPAHLQSALSEAAENELIMAVELWGSKDAERRRMQRGRIVQAVRVIDLLEANSCSREQIGWLADRAVGDQDPERWPTTQTGADDLLARASLTRDLIMLRDVVGGNTLDEEADDPD